MSKLKHTPGPWEIKDIENDANYIRIRGKKLGFRYKIANVIAEFSNEIDESKANARLIAAAPDILEILIGLSKYLRPRYKGQVNQINTGSIFHKQIDQIIEDIIK
jgi:hypothetical protein